MSAGAAGSLKFGFGVALVKIRSKLDRRGATGRAGVERGFGAAELIDQRAEGCGPDILAADQPEPAQALTVVQLERGEPGGALLPASDLLRANTPLLASQQASDVVGVAPKEKHGEDQEQQCDARLPIQRRAGREQPRSPRVPRAMSSG